MLCETHSVPSNEATQPSVYRDPALYGKPIDVNLQMKIFLDLALGDSLSEVSVKYGIGEVRLRRVFRRRVEALRRRFQSEAESFPPGVRMQDIREHNQFWMGLLLRYIENKPDQASH